MDSFTYLQTEHNVQGKLSRGWGGMGEKSFALFRFSTVFISLAALTIFREKETCEQAGAGSSIVPLFPLHPRTRDFTPRGSQTALAEENSVYVGR